jgi:L-asparaginase
MIFPILLITTGGTISGWNAKQTRKRSDVDIQKAIQPSLKAIQRETGKNVHLETINLFDLDSSNIQPAQWEALAETIHRSYDHYDAFLITHGTNSLGYSAAALAFAFENLDKPVILTGSQVTYGVPGSDAILNLENALRVAIGPNGQKMRGVMAVFGSHIITGPRVKKTTEFDYDAFQTFTASSLGRIGRVITLNKANLEKHLSYQDRLGEPALLASDLLGSHKFDGRIVSLTEFPGLSPDIFQTLVEHNGIRGFILRAFGAGDASEHLDAGFQYLKRMQIPIVVTSQAPNGVSNFLVNGPGKRLADNDLAIPAWDMSIESQTTKLAWLLGQEGITYERIKELMVTDLRGEINAQR